MISLVAASEKEDAIRLQSTFALRPVRNCPFFILHFLCSKDSSSHCALAEGAPLFVCYLSLSGKFHASLARIPLWSQKFQFTSQFLRWFNPSDSAQRYSEVRNCAKGPFSTQSVLNLRVETFGWSRKCENGASGGYFKGAQMKKHPKLLHLRTIFFYPPSKRPPTSGKDIKRPTEKLSEHFVPSVNTKVFCEKGFKKKNQLFNPQRVKKYPNGISRNIKFQWLFVILCG